MSIRKTATFRGVFIPAEIWDNKTLDWTHKLVWAEAQTCMYDFANDEIKPEHIDRMVKKFGLTENKVRKIFETLRCETLPETLGAEKRTRRKQDYMDRVTHLCGLIPDSDLFKPALVKWIIYKKGSYQDNSIPTLKKRLYELSKGDYLKADKIVDACISNTYKGLFVPTDMKDTQTGRINMIPQRRNADGSNMIIMRPEDGGHNYKPDIQQPHPDALFIDGVVWELNWNEQFEFNGYRYPQVAGKTRVQHLPVHIKRQYQQFFNIKK